ncbi:hypothetical protein SAMN05216330_11862 [Bradyrhizobium sp. Ghvi]|nr:hypothetical protein SAMN05216330_11862 [Bradyrhizobium sp. Ghvi]
MHFFDKYAHKNVEEQGLPQGLAEMPTAADLYSCFTQIEENAAMPMRLTYHQRKASFLAQSLRSDPGSRLLAQRPFQIALHETALGPVHGQAAYADAPADLLVAGLRIGNQRSLGAVELARRILAAAESPPKFAALDSAEFDPTAYIHAYLPERQARTTESDGRRESLGKKTSRLTGAVPRLHPPLYVAAPQTLAERDMQDHFGVSPAWGAPNGTDIATSRPHQKGEGHRAACRPDCRAIHERWDEAQSAETFPTSIAARPEHAGLPERPRCWLRMVFVTGTYANVTLVDLAC